MKLNQRLRRLFCRHRWDYGYTSLGKRKDRHGHLVSVDTEVYICHRCGKIKETIKK